MDGICSDLNCRFHWFDKEFTVKMIEASEQFLYFDLKYYLFVISDKPQDIWKGNDYFVTQIDIDWECPLFIKISDIATQLILDNVFGKNEKQEGEFGFKDITELEAQILTSYNEFLFSKITDVFREKTEIEELRSLEETRKNLLYLTFYIYPTLESQQEAGKIILSFPEYALKEPEVLAIPEQSIDILRFQNNYTRANIFVGKSRLTLEDIKLIEPGDIVLLEMSNLHFMTIVNGEEITFSVNPDPGLVINSTSTTGGQIMNNTDTSAKSIWDNLQVEVSAEFKKIKISLGELRQITEGLVVDIASIVENEILLHIDGEKIAKGELVIIGDKYGVKVTKIFHETDQAEKIVNDTSMAKKQYKDPEENIEENSEYTQNKEISLENEEEFFNNFEVGEDEDDI